jgi:glycosyltransferase involved in cell wall biosynthesis
MGSEPTVAVCVPTYEGAAFVAATLESIAAQQRPADQVLVVDDASTDDTLDLVEGFRDRLPGLRVERNAVRLGITANQNRCLELAEADWVVLMGQDDLLDPDHLARKVPWAVEGTGMVVAGRRYHLEGELRAMADAYALVTSQYIGEQLGDVTLSPQDFVRSMRGRLGLNAIGEPVAVLFRRQLALDLGGFDVAYRQIWDLDLWLRLGVAATSTFLRAPLATFRAHLDSASWRHMPHYDVRHLELLGLRAKVTHDRALAPLRPALRRRPEVPGWVDSALLAHHAHVAAGTFSVERSADLVAWQAVVDDLFRGHLRPLRHPAVLGTIARGTSAVRHYRRTQP